ncbi:DUF423 domain-containing protein [Gloeobacter kilaueensis]|uniref:DUF423 domain-containing protein n=1 Tax=Gloeobacter kilaueensis (strain ATCC BAA-2537 / CCAP 1431/1 / ULC 316 / JS1) TaxID=1183438 RepID=U5QHF2_GLOK1|nr:DUF423 domain-containing protein [Gloeobacter kilaueensis]AGY58341.1 hypothetical protein GKIL_2095 [Gloeobacter kilaueensis JS1]
MFRFFLATAAVLAGLAVAAGAFATHALRSQLDERALEIFETAARYQMYHALALILVALLLERSGPNPLLTVSGYAFIAGTLIFSGSLYALSLSGIKWLGAITPLGGAAYLLGWLCLALAAWNYK